MCRFNEREASVQYVVNDVIDNVRRMFQAINEFSKSAERSTGLTGPQLWALKLIACTNTRRVSELANQMSLSAPTVVGIIDRLEGKGLIIRSISHEDRRVVHLHLTPQGESLVNTAPEVAQDLIIKGLSGLTDEQRYTVVEGMKLIVAILGAEQLEPLPLH